MIKKIGNWFKDTFKLLMKWWTGCLGQMADIFGAARSSLSADKDGNLFVNEYHNQNNLIGERTDGTPILPLDVLECTYYIGYKNLRQIM